MSAALNRPLPAEEASGPFAEAVAHVERDKARVVLTRAGQPVVPVEDMARLEAWEDEEDARLGEQALMEWEAQGRPSGAIHDDLLGRYGIPTDAE